MTTKKLKRFSFDETITTSKFNFTKNLKWFIIPSIAIFVVGIILLCTLGFNFGLDFTGGSIMTVYANNEALVEDAEVYDIDDRGSYQAMQQKIESVLAEFDLSGSSYQSTTIDIADLGVYHGQAIVVKFQNAQQETSDILSTNSQIEARLVEEFGYSASPSAVANGGIVTPNASTEMVVNAFIAIIVALVLIAIYVGLRFGVTSAFTATLCLFHDILITSSLVLMMRLTVNFSFIAALVVVMCYSACNQIIMLSRLKEYQRSGRFEGEKNETIANAATKETLTSLIFSTLIALFCMLLIGIIGVSDMRAFAFPIVIGILSTFYSSVFLAPGLWSIAFKRKNKKLEPTSTQESKNSQEIAG